MDRPSQANGGGICNRPSLRDLSPCRCAPSRVKMLVRHGPDRVSDPDGVLKGRSHDRLLDRETGRNHRDPTKVLQIAPDNAVGVGGLCCSRRQTLVEIEGGHRTNTPNGLE